jgi:quinol monooxygenase YgiN
MNFVCVMLMEDRYASQEALDRHRTSEEYQNFFKALTAESIFEGPPEIVTGAYKYGFWRS